MIEERKQELKQLLKESMKTVIIVYCHRFFRPHPKGRLCYNTLSSIMQSLKGYTARRVNQLLGRRGAFWQHESYDHCVRNPNGWRRIITYVLNSPVKAGLVDEWEKWQWNYYRSVNF